MLFNNKRSAYFKEKDMYTVTHVQQWKRYGVTFRYKITQKIKITKSASKLFVHAKQVIRGNFMSEKNV